MIYDSLSENELRVSGVFENNTEYILYLLMKYIQESETPVGAWVLREKLVKHEIDCGTATVGRYLRILDGREYTISKGNQGRILTPQGSLQLRKTEKMLEQLHIQNTLNTAMQISEYKDLIDLLYVRKILEAETAASAARYATEEELELLREAFAAHERCVSDNNDPTETALAFHQTIADICHNKFLQAIIQLLLFKEIEIERSIESLVSREMGGTYVKDHQAITEAICNRETKKAGDLMSQHVRAIYSDVFYSTKK